MKIENIEGNLKEAYSKCKKGTMLHVDEIMKERLTKPELRNQWFYTADGMFYFLKGGVPHLAIAREKDNLILKNIDQATTQLLNEHNYTPSEKEFRKVLKSKDTVIVNLAKMNLITLNSEWSYLEIKPATVRETPFLERIYGKGKQFKEVMKSMHQANIATTRIYVLNPNYVKEKRKILGRASRLDDFNFDFGADSRVVNYLRVRLRGVRFGHVHQFKCKCGATQ